MMELKKSLKISSSVIHVLAVSRFLIKWPAKLKNFISYFCIHSSTRAYNSEMREHACSIKYIRHTFYVLYH